MVGYLLHPPNFDDWKWSTDKRCIHNNEVTSQKIPTLVEMQKKSLVTILRPVDICHQLNSSMQAGSRLAELEKKHLLWAAKHNGLIIFLKKHSYIRAPSFSREILPQCFVKYYLLYYKILKITHEKKGILLQIWFQPTVLSLRALNIFPQYTVCR